MSNAHPYIKQITFTPWPKRPDGTNKTMGEMTPEERRAQIKASVERVKADLLNVDLNSAH